MSWRLPPDDPYLYSHLFEEDQPEQDSNGQASDGVLWQGCHEREGAPLNTRLPDNAVLAAHSEAPRNAVAVHAEDDRSTLTVHVQEGVQYRTFIRTLRQACIQAQLGEVTPTASQDDLAHRFVLVRAPSDSASMVYGGLIYDFNPPLGLIVRRTTLSKRLACTLAVSPDSPAEARAMRKLRRRGVSHAHALCRAAWQRKPPPWTALPRLTPVALPTDDALITALRSAMQAHNTASPGARVYVYPGTMLRRHAAANAIQAAWRAHCWRLRLPLALAVVQHRAALCIQRAWRSRLFVQHLHALAAASTLRQSLSALTAVPRLCLTLLSARVLGMTRARAHQCLPSHCLKFVFLAETAGVALLAPASAARPQLPAWLGCSLPAVPQELCVFPAGTEAEDGVQQLQLTQTPTWFTNREMVSDDDGLIYIAAGPFGAADCLELLERDVQNENLMAADGAKAHADGIPADAAEDDALHAFGFADCEEAMRRAVLLLLLTYDPLLEQAAELIPAAATCATKAALRPLLAALRLHGQSNPADAVDEPPGPCYGNPRVLPMDVIGSHSHEHARQVQMRLAAAIALSLPGDSSLLPFLHTITAAYSTEHAAAPVCHQDVARQASGAVHFYTPMLPYLHSYPLYLESLRHASQVKHGKAMLLEIESHTEHMDAYTEICDTPADSGSAPAQPATPAELSTTLFAESLQAAQQHVEKEPHVVASERARGAALHHLSDGSRAMELWEGQYVAAATSVATTAAVRAAGKVVHANGHRALTNTAVTKALAGAFGRLEQQEAHAFLQMRTADILTRKQVIVNMVHCLPAQQPRSVNTGNRTAPLYTPLSVTTLTRTVQQLKAVWVERNHEVVTALRTARRLALASMHREVAQWRQQRAQSMAHQREVASRKRRQARAEEDAAQRARVQAAQPRRQRQVALAAMRANTAAGGAAIAAEARLVRTADQYKAEQRAQAQQSARARAQWLGRLSDRERAYDRKRHTIAKRTAAAAAVRSHGYTQQAHEQHAAQMRSREAAVADAKAEREGAQAKAGMPGGLWGAATPRQHGLPAYPTAIVAAASETAAAQHDKELQEFVDTDEHAYDNFMTVTTGNGGSHAAKIAYGQYVGTGSTAFGRSAVPLPAPVKFGHC